MHCFKDHINNRKYFLHFIRLLLPPKSPILPNLGGDPYMYVCQYQLYQQPTTNNNNQQYQKIHTWVPMQRPRNNHVPLQHSSYSPAEKNRSKAHQFIRAFMYMMYVAHTVLPIKKESLMCICSSHSVCLHVHQCELQIHECRTICTKKVPSHHLPWVKPSPQWIQNVPHQSMLCFGHLNN